YRLPATPTLDIFNHVITYIPALGLYLDSTAESIAAGYLPAAVMDKPVLLVKSGTLARTPGHQRERSRSFSWFAIDKDGRSKFSMAKISEGAVAEPYRQAVRDTKQADRKLFVEHMLQGLGQRGEGEFDAGQLDGKGDQYSMRAHGNSDNFASLPGPVGLATSFNFWGGLSETVLALGQERVRTQDFVCPAFDTEEETGFTFPEGVTIIAMPRPVTLHDADLDYSARYTRHDNIVTVQRRAAFRHHGMVCTAADYQRMQPLLDQITRDLKSQVIIGN
ncbi:MAG: hypothetical protein WKG03_20155, partial [Telluria sp.]